MELECPILFDIYRGTSHDGPGLRTTLFFKGCPMKCLWCHNPEGISPKPEIWWDTRKCIGCGLCSEACKHNACIADGNGIHINRPNCVRCGECVKACPANALCFDGEKWSIEKLLTEALKDKSYYTAFGGGVTVSGGEPMMQYKQVKALFKELKQRGVHTALDTCGDVPWQAFEEVLPDTECVLYDLKLMDTKEHKKYTGHGNEQIKNNLCLIADYICKADRTMQLWVRTPLIPNATATGRNIEEIGVFIKNYLGDVIERWELIAFNNICKTKYEKMGIKWAYKNEELLDQKTLDKMKDAAIKSGVANEKLVVSGIAAVKSKDKT